MYSLILFSLLVAQPTAPRLDAGGRQVRDARSPVHACTTMDASGALHVMDSVGRPVAVVPAGEILAGVPELALAPGRPGSGIHVAIEQQPDGSMIVIDDAGGVVGIVAAGDRLQVTNPDPTTPLDQEPVGDFDDGGSSPWRLTDMGDGAVRLDMRVFERAPVYRPLDQITIGCATPQHSPCNHWVRCCSTPGSGCTGWGKVDVGYGTSVTVDCGTGRTAEVITVNP